MNTISNTIVHWLHLVAVVVLVGGTILMRFAVHPASEQLEGEAKETFKRAVKRKMTMLVHSSILIVVLTGFYNFVRRATEGIPMYYNIVFMVKFIAAFGALGLAVALTVSSKFDERRAHWLMLNVLLGLLVILLSAWLRMIPPEFKH